METDIETLARRFRRFGERECVPASPLYGRLSVGIADDHALLQIATAAGAHPVPNLFFAAVHYLLLRGAAHPLAAFFPDLAENLVHLGGDPSPALTMDDRRWTTPSSSVVHRPSSAQPDANFSNAAPGADDPFPHFRAFCLERAEAIRGLLETRLVQTNEVRRCACLLPALALVAERARRPLALVEVGASAGLNLLWDRYHYDYGAGAQCGDPASAVRLACDLRGPGRPKLPVAMPAIASRVGLDLAPVDVRDDEAALWLRALIWPEQRDRAALLANALAVARQNPPPLLAGDALDLLPGALAQAPAGAAPCVYHSFVLNQFPRAARERFAALLADHGARRDLYVVAIEWRDEPAPTVKLTAYASGARSELHLANCDPHGGWLEWL